MKNEHNADPVRLTDEMREALPNMIKGIEAGIWRPSWATKRLLADVFRRALWMDAHITAPGFGPIKVERTDG